MLWPADITATTHLDIDQANVAHSIEMGSHRVGMQRQRVGDLGSDQRPGRAGQFEVNRITSVVTERLEDVELRGTSHSTRLHGRSR